MLLKLISSRKVRVSFFLDASLQLHWKADRRVRHAQLDIGRVGELHSHVEEQRRGELHHEIDWCPRPTNQHRV